MQLTRALTPDRRKSAQVGVGLAVAGIAVLAYGSFLLPDERQLFAGVVLVVFGLLLATSAVLVFLLPAAYDYWEEGTAVTPVSRIPA